MKFAQGKKGGPFCMSFVSLVANACLYRQTDRGLG